MLKIYLNTGVVVYRVNVMGRVMDTLPLVEGSLNDIRLRYAVRHSNRSGHPEQFMECLRASLAVFPGRG